MSDSGLKVSHLSINMNGPAGPGWQHYGISLFLSREDGVQPTLADLKMALNAILDVQLEAQTQPIPPPEPTPQPKKSNPFQVVKP